MRDTDFTDRGMFFEAVREVAGEQGVHAIYRRFGGRHLTVPCARVYGTSPLAQALGEEAEVCIANKLRVIGADDRVMAGPRIYVPRNDDAIRIQWAETASVAGAARAAQSNAIRRAAVDAVVRGLTRAEAALNFGIKERTVQRGIEERLCGNRLTNADREWLRKQHGVPAKDQHLAFDAAVVAAFEADPDPLEMAARLGIKPKSLSARLRRMRKRSRPVPRSGVSMVPAEISMSP